MYRLMNYNQVANSRSDATPLMSPVNKLVRCLGACVVADPEWHVELRDYPGTVTMRSP